MRNDLSAYCRRVLLTLLLCAPLFTPMASALEKAELAAIIGVPEEKLSIKDLSYSASSQPGALWAINGSADEAIYPFSIIAYQQGFRFTDDFKRELDALVAIGNRSGITKHLKRIEVHGAGFSGLLGLGPDCVIHTAVMSLPKASIDLEVAVVLDNDTPELRRTQWNEEYLNRFQGSDGATEFLYKFAENLGNLSPGRLKAFEQPRDRAPVVLNSVSALSSGTTDMASRDSGYPLRGVEAVPYQDQQIPARSKDSITRILVFMTITVGIACIYGFKRFRKP